MYRIIPRMIKDKNMKENVMSSVCLNCAFCVKNTSRTYICGNEKKCVDMSEFVDKDQDTENRKKEILQGESEDTANMSEAERLKVIYSKKMITLDETALLLGMSKAYLYKLTYERRIPHYKPMGKFIYFDREEVEAWMRRVKVEVVK